MSLGILLLNGPRPCGGFHHCGIFHDSYAVGWLFPGIEPMAPAVEAQNFNHWTLREVPLLSLFVAPFPSPVTVFPFISSLPASIVSDRY